MKTCHETLGKQVNSLSVILGKVNLGEQCPAPPARTHITFLKGSGKAEKAWPLGSDHLCDSCFYHWRSGWHLWPKAEQWLLIFCFPEGEEGVENTSNWFLEGLNGIIIVMHPRQSSRTINARLSSLSSCLLRIECISFMEVTFLSFLPHFIF